ncbi:MAG: hypothetical protein Q7S66_00640 [bacterium]|nr:hypothetical protein [bacterium]
MAVISQRRRGVANRANFGLVDGKRLAALANEGKIALEKGKYYVLPGTVLRDPDGNLRVACLGWDGDHWVVYFAFLGLDWGEPGRFVRCKSAA